MEKLTKQQESIADQIIKLIKINRISTTEVADCMGKSGLFADAKPIQQGMFNVGKVRWMYAYNDSNWTIHEIAREIEPSEIVMIESFNCGERSTIGELVSKYMLLYQQAEAIITNQNMRDANSLLRERFSIWCKGFSPIGCFNTKCPEPLDPEIYKEHYERYQGSIAVCDDSGVVIIPKELQTEEFYQKLVAIEDQEDIWFDCLDHRKWDTFDIVCLKKYRNTGDK